MDKTWRGARALIVFLMVSLTLILSGCESEGHLYIHRNDTFTVQMTIGAPKESDAPLKCEKIEKIFKSGGGENSGEVEDLSTETDTRCRVTITNPQPISTARHPFPSIVHENGRYRVTLDPDLLKSTDIRPGTKLNWTVTFPGKVLDVTKSNGGEIVAENTVRWTDTRILYKGFTVSAAEVTLTSHIVAQSLRDLGVALLLTFVLSTMMQTTLPARIKSVLGRWLDRFALLYHRWIHSLSPIGRRRVIKLANLTMGLRALILSPFRRRARKRRQKERQRWLKKQAHSPWQEVDNSETNQFSVAEIMAAARPGETQPETAEKEDSEEVSTDSRTDSIDAGQLASDDDGGDCAEGNRENETQSKRSNPAVSHGRRAKRRAKSGVLHRRFTSLFRDDEEDDSAGEKMKNHAGEIRVRPSLVVSDDVAEDEWDLANLSGDIPDVTVLPAEERSAPSITSSAREKRKSRPSGVGAHTVEESAEALTMDDQAEALEKLWGELAVSGGNRALVSRSENLGFASRYAAEEKDEKSDEIHLAKRRGHREDSEQEHRSGRLKLWKSIRRRRGEN